MRTLRFRPSLSLPTCIHRKVSDERPRRTLEMGDFPMHILESRRKERLAELKAECLDLKNQLSENSLPAAVLREAQDINQTNGSVTSNHSKSVQDLRRLPAGPNKANSASTINIEESFRKRREERLKILRRELEEFAIKYSLGEYAEKIDGLDRNVVPLRKSKSVDSVNLKVSSSNGGQSPQSEKLVISGPLQGVNAANAAIFLRIQKQREQELQRARLELKHLAFRLKHKIDKES